MPRFTRRPLALCPGLPSFDCRYEQQPALFTVLREVDLRASYEQGWRTALADVVRTADSAVDLVIATVKGVSLTPDRAAEVLDQLGSLLTQERG